MKLHNFLPKRLEDPLMRLASRFQILDHLVLPLASTFQGLDFFF